MPAPGPAALGRGVVVLAGGAVPSAWADAPVVTVDDAVLSDPGPAVAGLHEAWAARRPRARVLRLEGLDTDNGPDLYLYLTTTPADGEGSGFDDDFVNLGRLKGNQGDQNYGLAADVDLGRYATVVIGSDRFTPPSEQPTSPDGRQRRLRPHPAYSPLCPLRP